MKRTFLNTVTNTKRKLYLSKRQFSLLVCSALTFTFNPFASLIFCDGRDLVEWTDGNWSNILTNFCNAAAKWIFLAGIIMFALWALIPNQKKKEIFFDGFKGCAIAFIIVNIPTTIYDLFIGIAEWFK